MMSGVWKRQVSGKATRFDGWMMLSTWSSNRVHDGGASSGDRCATVIEREIMKASIMELC